MRDVRNRQQALLAAALFCAVARCFADSDAVARELLELKHLEGQLLEEKADEREWKKLEARYAALIERNPKNVPVREARGIFLWSRNEHEGAIREWLAAVRLEPRNVVMLDRVAGAYLEVGDPRTALEYYLRATEGAPGNAQSHFGAANIASLFRHSVGRTEEQCFDLAIKHFAEAHRLSPQNREYARGYAELFYTLPNPDWQAALAAWKSYLNLASEKSFAYTNLARVHMKLGDAKSARDCLKQVTGVEYEKVKNRLLARIDAELSEGKESDLVQDEKNVETRD